MNTFSVSCPTVFLSVCLSVCMSACLLACPVLTISPRSVCLSVLFFVITEMPRPVFVFIIYQVPLLSDRISDLMSFRETRKRRKELVYNIVLLYVGFIYIHVNRDYAQTSIVVALIVVNLFSLLILLETVPFVADHLWTQYSPIYPVTVGGETGPYIEQGGSTCKV